MLDCDGVVGRLVERRARRSDLDGGVVGEERDRHRHAFGRGAAQAPELDQIVGDRGRVDRPGQLEEEVGRGGEAVELGEPLLGIANGLRVPGGGGQVDLAGGRIEQEVDRDRHALRRLVHRQLDSAGDGEGPERGDVCARQIAGGEEVEERGEVGANLLELGGVVAPLLRAVAREGAFVLRCVEALLEPEEVEGGVALDALAGGAADTCLAAAHDDRVGRAAIPPGARCVDRDRSPVAGDVDGGVRDASRVRAPPPYLEGVGGHGRGLDGAVELDDRCGGRGPAVHLVEVLVEVALGAREVVVDRDVERPRDLVAQDVARHRDDLRLGIEPGVNDADRLVEIETAPHRRQRAQQDPGPRGPRASSPRRRTG